jgi:CHASE3 domain sensor protein
MHRPLVRTLLVVLALLAAGGAGYKLFLLDRDTASARQAWTAFDTRALQTSAWLSEMRAAQRGYVALGQGDEFWMKRVAALSDSARQDLDRLKRQARSADAARSLESAANTLAGFARLDATARSYIANDRRLVASDLIFGEGLEALTAMVTAIEDARGYERAAVEREAEQARRTGFYVLIAAAGVVFGILLLLAATPGSPATPGIRETLGLRETGETKAPGRGAEAAAIAALVASQQGAAERARTTAASPAPPSSAAEPPQARPAAPGFEPAPLPAAASGARVTPGAVQPAAPVEAAPGPSASGTAAPARDAAPAPWPAAPAPDVAVSAPAPTPARAAAGPAPGPAPLASVAAAPSPAAPGPAPAAPSAEPPAPSLAEAARLCADLARVTEAQELPGLLQRAAALLDAAGIIVWLQDPLGHELRPAVSHGYSPSIMARVQAIPRDANNATAAAFRSGELRTVTGDGFSNGALVVPLVTSAGPVGAMAAEIRHGGEMSKTVHAVATLIAAQLATLVSVGGGGK